MLKSHNQLQLTLIENQEMIVKNAKSRHFG